MRRYASVTSSFETRMGPLAVSASHIAWRMHGYYCPPFIDSGATSLPVLLVTLGVTSSGFFNRLRMRRSRRCAWGTAMVQESLNFSPDIRTVYAAERGILEPSCTLGYISLRTNIVISEENSDA